jgi:cytochrome c oxidase subunit 2
VWFEATRVGDTLLECAEFCGKDHSHMLATVTVMEEPDFNKWVEDQNKPTGTPEEQGAKLYLERGCKGCHSTDGTTFTGGGPSFKGLFGRSETMSDGTTLTVDENYIRESMMQPAAKVVKGFPAGVMPTFQGTLKDEQISAIIAFIKAQK